MDDGTTQPLLSLTFGRGKLRYMPDFSVEVEGIFWPRELIAAVEILKQFKEQHKESARQAESRTK